MSLTPEQRAKKAARDKARWLAKTPEQRIKRRAVHRARYHALTQEQRDVRRANARRCGVAWRKKHREKYQAQLQVVRDKKCVSPSPYLGYALKRYQITVERYHELLLRQGGVCAICGEAPKVGKRLHVDHCHDTRVVRGLLCGLCNRGLGMYRDQPSLLLKAASYLNGGRDG